jgi:hypothetical protein
MGCIIIHYIFPGKLEDIMNTTIIPIPEKIKCFVQLNNDDRYCYNDLAVKNEFSQYNANVDLWTIGHIFFWGLTGYICEFQPKFIFILSILWELFEIILGKLNLPFAGRITDVFMNMIGYLIGYTLKRG